MGVGSGGKTSAKYSFMGCLANYLKLDLQTTGMMIVNMEAVYQMSSTSCKFSVRLYLYLLSVR